MNICLPGIKSGIYCQLGENKSPTTFSKEPETSVDFGAERGIQTQTRSMVRINKQDAGVTSRYMYSMWLILLMEKILHQLIGSLSQYLQRLDRSQVVQDFSHQQYIPYIDILT